MSTLTIIFAENETKKLSSGDFFRIMESSAGVNVQFFKHGRAITDLDEGLLAGWSNAPRRPGENNDISFDYVEVTSPTVQTCKFYIGFGSARYDRIEGDITTDRTATFDGLDDMELAETASTTLLAADSGRRLANITNLPDNANVWRVGGVGSTSATKGTPLSPGQTMTVHGVDAIEIFNSGVAEFCAISVEKD